MSAEQMSNAATSQVAEKLVWRAPVIEVFEANNALVGTNSTPGDGPTFPLTHTS